MWESINSALNEAARSAKAVEGTAWGGAIGGLIAAITEGTRFAKKRVDKLNGDITDLQNRLKSTETKLDAVFTPVTPPGIPSITNVNVGFATNGGNVVVIQGSDDRSMRLKFDNNGQAVAADTKLCTIKFGKPYTAAPKVIMQRVGSGGGASDTAELYPDQATTQGVDIYVNAWVAGEPVAYFDLIVLGPQQAPA